MGQDKADAVFILPEFITLMSDSGCYMWSGSSDLRVLMTERILHNLHSGMQQKDVNSSCTFEVTQHASGRFSLRGSSGRFITQFTSRENVTYFGYPDYGSATEFEIIRVRGNQVYLRSTSSPCVFMTTKQYGASMISSAFATPECLITISEPVVSKEIISIDYDIPKAAMREVPPIIALNTTVRNDSKTNDVKQTLSYSYQRSTVGTWNNSAGIELGVETKFSAEVPFISSVELTISYKDSATREWGGSKGEEESINTSTEITVPAGKKGTATILVKRSAMDITFRCREKTMYKDGSSKITEKEGVYRNIESYLVDVKSGDWVDV